MTTPCEPILNRTEGHVDVYLDPSDAMKLVARLRRVSFFIRSNVDLVTDFGDDGLPSRVYPGMGGSIPVSAKVATDMLRDLAGFNERKAARGEDVGVVTVTRLGDCIFFG